MQVKNRKAPLFIQEVQFQFKQNNRLPFKSKSSIVSLEQSAITSGRNPKIPSLQKPFRQQYRYSEQSIFPSIKRQQSIINKKLSFACPAEIPIIQKNQPIKKIKHLRNKSEKYLAKIQMLKETNTYQKIYFISNLTLQQNLVGQFINQNIENLQKAKDQSKDKRQKRIANKKTVQNAPQQLITRKINQQYKILLNKNGLKIDYENIPKKQKIGKRKLRILDDKLEAIEGWNIPTAYKKSIFEDF